MIRPTSARSWRWTGGVLAASACCGSGRTKERIDKAKKLKLIITAGIGSDHTDLQAAMDKGITVAEITYSNSISVAEHVVMMILQQHIKMGGELCRGPRRSYPELARSMGACPHLCGVEG